MFLGSESCLNQTLAFRSTTRNTNAHTHAYKHLHICILTNTHAHTHMKTHTHICVHSHTHAHTNKHTQKNVPIINCAITCLVQIELEGRRKYTEQGR